MSDNKTSYLHSGKTGRIPVIHFKKKKAREVKFGGYYFYDAEEIKREEEKEKEEDC